MVENNGKPYFLMDDLGGTTIFQETPNGISSNFLSAHFLGYQFNQISEANVVNFPAAWMTILLRQKDLKTGSFQGKFHLSSRYLVRENARDWCAKRTKMTAMIRSIERLVVLIGNPCILIITSHIQNWVVSSLIYPKQPVFS